MQKLLERLQGCQATFQAFITAWQSPSSRTPHFYMCTNNSKGKFVSKEVKKTVRRDIFRDGRTAVSESWFFCARLSRMTALVRDSVIICFWNA